VLYATGIQARPADLGPPDPEESWVVPTRAMLLEQLQGTSPGSTMYVIEIDGKRVGRLRVVRSAEGLEIAGIQILPERQNSGIGAAVIGELQAEARAQQVPAALKVAVDNPNAERLYVRLGFSRGEREGDDYWMTALS
jgi:ribosomal protein S18 acetylase RimI-like enzyme